MSEDKTIKYDWIDRAPEIAGGFVQVAGMLAGFSFTAVILIAGLYEKKLPDAPRSILEEAGMGMFMIAFIGHISTAVLFSMVSERDGAHRRFLFVAATSLFYMTGLFTFAALLPLQHMFGISHLKLAMFLVLTSAVFGGYIGIALPARDLLSLDLKHCFAPLGIALLALIPFTLVAWLLVHCDQLQVLLQCILIIPLLAGAFIYVFSHFTFLRTWPDGKSHFGWLAMATMVFAATAVLFSVVATGFLVRA